MRDEWIAPLRAAFPNAKILLIGVSDTGQINERFRAWMPSLINNNVFKPGGADGISLHPYYYVNDVGLTKASAGNRAAASAAGAQAFEIFRNIVNGFLMGGLPPGLEIYVTEYGVLEDITQTGYVVLGQSWLHGCLMIMHTLVMWADPRINGAAVHSMIGNAQWAALHDESGRAIDPTKRGIDDEPWTEGLATPLSPTLMGTALGLLANNVAVDGGEGLLLANDQGLIAWRVTNATTSKDAIAAVNTTGDPLSFTLPVDTTWSDRIWTNDPWLTLPDVTQLAAPTTGTGKTGNYSLAGFTFVILDSEGAAAVDEIGNLPNGSAVIVAFGWQSNGRGHPLGTAYTGAEPTNTQVWDDATDDWIAYVSDSNGYTAPMSPTLAFVLKFEADYPNLDLYVIEAGQGGVGFQNGAGPFADGNAIHTETMDKLRAASAALTVARQDYYVLGYSFWQGEKDTESTTWADAYQAQLSGFLDDVDAAMGMEPRKIITRIHPNTPQTVADVNTVRAAHVALADTLIDIDSYSTLADNLHFAIADYQAIGESYIDEIKGFAPTLVAAGGALDQSFGGLTELPIGWSLDDATASFTADGVTITTTSGAQQWRDAFLVGPQVDWARPVEMYFKGLVSQNAAGLAVDPATWLNAGADSLVSIWDSLYQGNQNIFSWDGTDDMVPDQDYRLTYTRSGADIVVTLATDTGGGFADVNSTTVVGAYAGMENARFMVDPKNTPVVLQRVVN